MQGRTALRNSCVVCYTSKVRCTPEKHSCTRCQKIGVTCNYSPPKRPGRPRRVIAAAATRPALPSSPAGSRLKEEDQSKSHDPSSSSSIISSYSSPRSGDQVYLPPAGRSVSGSVWDEDLAAAAGAGPALPANSLLPDAAQFHDECIALEQLLTSVSRFLKLLDSQPSSSGGNSGTSHNNPTGNGQCRCHIAMVNLQRHWRSLCHSPPNRLLEAGLHVQRFLQWTWTVYQDCSRCRGDDDGMGRLIITWLARHVVQVCGRIIADHARRSYSPGSADAASPLDSARLRWGRRSSRDRQRRLSSPS